MTQPVETKALSVKEEPSMAASPALFGSHEPRAIVAAAAERANILSEVVKQKGLTSRISGREFVRVEGWTLLGSLCGVFPVCSWTRPVKDAEGRETGWEARVEARTMSGAVIGAAEASCLHSERNWGNRDSYALRSMAQTRATSKALRQPLGFIMTLAGFEATPAEEMDAARDEPRPAAAKPPPPPANKGTGATFKVVAGKLSGGSADDYHEAVALFNRFDWSDKTRASFAKARSAAAKRLGLEPDFETPAVAAAFDAGRKADLDAAGDEAARGMK